MMLALRNLTLKQKAMAMASGATMSLLVIAGAGLYQLYAVGDEVEAMAERDVPASRLIAQISMQQSEQIIDLQQAALYATNMQADENLGFTEVQETKKYAAAAKDFRGDVGKVQKRIEKLRTTFENAKSLPGTDEEEIETLLSMTKTLEEDQTNLNEAGKAFLTTIEGHKWPNFPESLDTLKAAQKSAETRTNVLLARVQLNYRKAINDAVNTEDRGTLVVAGLTGATIVSSIFLSVIFSNLISRPLVQAVGAVESLAQGDTSVTVPCRSKDEVGRLAVALEKFRDNQNRLREIERQQAAERRQNERARLEQDQLVGMTGQSVSDILSTVSQQTADMTYYIDKNAELLSKAAEAVSTASQETQEATRLHHEVVTATEEMTHSIKEIANQVQQSSDKAKEATNLAQQSADKIRELKEAADEIGSVIDLITDIAERTNLLALNATIEAARAGESGKGFAVVAQEVKSLANQTTKATDQISQNIEKIRSETYASAESIDSIQSIIYELNDMAANIASAMEEQQTTTETQSQNLHHAATCLDNVNTRIEKAHQSVSDSKGGREQVRDRSANLQEQSRKLDSEIETLISQMRGQGQNRSEPIRVGMPASLMFQDGSTKDGQVERLAPGEIEFSPGIDASKGDVLQLDLREGTTVDVRVTDHRAGVAVLQPKLDPAQLEKIDRVMASHQ